MIDVKPLRYFVTLAETRHFGRAATRLNLSQPPLSRQIAALEAALGTRLLVRHARGVALTAAGERFYADARAILASIDQAGRNARAATLGDIGRLTLGFTMCAAFSVLPGYARAFAQACPEVELTLREVVSNDLAAKVIAGQMDAAIMFPGALSSALASRTLITEPFCVALSRQHPLARARELDIGQLAGEPFAMATSEVAPGLHAAIVEHCHAAGFEPDVRFEVQLQQTVLSLVEENVALALVPASMRRARLAGLTFRPLRAAPRISQVLVWSPANDNPCLTRFLELAPPLAAPRHSGPATPRAGRRPAQGLK